MNQREREFRRNTVRKLLTTALFVLDHDPQVSMVQTMLAVQEFAGWLDADSVKRTIHNMTDHAAEQPDG